MAPNETNPAALRARAGSKNVCLVGDDRENSASGVRLQPTPRERLYRVRPARPEGAQWRSADTHVHYVEIVRLTDGKRCATWKEPGWRESDAWAHSRWEAWRRMGWRPELAP
jgi:hypothetical protein